MTASTAQTRRDHRAAAALVLAVLAVATSLTFFWLYAIPPLLFAIPAVLLIRSLSATPAGLPRAALGASALVVVAVICDVVFLLKNIHHLY
jgi:hypothetical protein